MFKIKIPVVFHDRKCKFKQTTSGDWIDLRASENYSWLGPLKEVHTRKVIIQDVLIDLGISMKLPSFLEANIVSRSSTGSAFGLIQRNAFGVVDHTYCGQKDRWKFAGVAIKDGEIFEGDRVCQFRINLNQKATVWQKLRYMISTIEFVEVPYLDSPSRGGFGSSGKK